MHLAIHLGGVDPLRQGRLLRRQIGEEHRDEDPKVPVRSSARTSILFGITTVKPHPRATLVAPVPAPITTKRKRKTESSRPSPRRRIGKRPSRVSARSVACQSKLQTSNAYRAGGSNGEPAIGIHPGRRSGGFPIKRSCPKCFADVHGHLAPFARTRRLRGRRLRGNFRR